MKNLSNILLLALIGAGFAGCAHQSTVTPSNGHIDGQSNPSQPNQLAAADIPKPVKTPAYLPPPKAKAKEQTYSVVVNDVPVKEILFALARESKLNVDINSGVQGRVTLNAVDQTLPAILERLSKQVDLTYKIENNVLYIGPDLPVLRTYKVDYVNMSRDTTGFIGVAAEISGTGRSASTGSSGSSTTGTAGGSSSSGASSNSSRTQVASISQNHFWASLIQNIKDILAETDKEVIISRGDGSDQTEASTTTAPSTSADSSNPSDKTNITVNLKPTAQDREAARTEYKTLFAATVIANQEAGIISVRGTSKQHEKVQEFLDKVMSSAKRQVLIEATIVEVRLNDGYQAGIDWSRLNNAGAGLVAGFVNGAKNFSASISLLQQFGDTKVLSSPKLMVLNNQTAVLKVVDNLVYFTVQSQISQSASGTTGTNLQSFTTTANTVPVGVVMSVTPQINDTGEVNINVRPTISRLIRYVPDPNPLLTGTANGAITNQGVPEIQVREMESMLQINSGNTAVLGGLMQDQIQRNTDKVPGLSNIPGLGRLFTGRSDVSKKTELVIFLRPTVIKSASLESDELKAYQQYLPAPQLEKKLDGNGY